jgi:hypothetical protein
MPGVPSPLAGRNPGDIDFFVVRENSRPSALPQIRRFRLGVRPGFPPETAEPAARRALCTSDWRQWRI